MIISVIIISIIIITDHSHNHHQHYHHCSVINIIIIIIITSPLSSGFFGQQSNVSITYAGGIRSFDDIELVKRLGKSVVDCTIGSALDMFGGELKYDEVVQWSQSQIQDMLC